ncbi:hypothetical protein V6N13_098741 [Hibiscus sabdariffa]
MLANLPRTRHVHLYLVEEEIPKQTKNELVNKHVSEDAFEQAETKFMFTKPSIELQVETFSEDVFEQRETEHYTEPQAEPQIEPQAEPQTKQQVQTVSEASMEPEHEPSRFDDTEPDDSEDSDYNGSFWDIPSAAKRRVESEFESDVSDSLHNLDGLDSGAKKKKKRLIEFNSATDMDNPDFKGYNQGHILVAVGIDANGCIYPIAYVVVDSENNSSWSWFLEMLDEELGLANSYHVSFMKDKQKFILDARDKPIITLLEIIRTKIIQRIAKKKVEANKWTTTLCPKIQQKCWSTHAGRFKYQVACGPRTQHAVDLEKHTCSCRMWQLTVDLTNRRKEADERDDHSGKVGKKWVKRTFGGIRKEAVARGNSSNQHPESNQRASTQPPTINVVRWAPKKPYTRIIFCPRCSQHNWNTTMTKGIEFLFSPFALPPAPSSSTSFLLSPAA